MTLRPTRLGPSAIVRLVLGLAVAFPLALAGDAGDPEERARAAASALASELMQRLGRELSAGGPVGAVAVCATVAPELAAAHSKDGLTIRRVSARPRNAAGGTPDAYEAAVLARFETDRAAGKPLGDVVEWQGEGPSRELRFMRPIVIGRTCLACHGAPEGIDPAVRKILTERYPADRAVGYREGDLRGAISVRVAAP